ncbi:MAG: DUF1476 domain-containing protein [Rhodospirillales bacterium]|nr:DUF1476 domain-containing protein [Rhodospirillales bacterium]
MNVFDEREKAFEAKYRLDEETAFKVNVRRDKLLGQWVAEKLGLSGKAAEDYARAVVEADFEEPGDKDVVRKVLKDLAAANIDFSEEKLAKEMRRLHEIAHEQIIADIKSQPLRD